MKCGDCKHWKAYQPIGGCLPVLFRGQGNCYPDGTKGKTRSATTVGEDECRIGRFEKKVDE